MTVHCYGVEIGSYTRQFFVYGDDRKARRALAKWIGLFWERHKRHVSEKYPGSMAARDERGLERSASSLALPKRSTGQCVHHPCWQLGEDREFRSGPGNATADPSVASPQHPKGLTVQNFRDFSFRLVGADGTEIVQARGNKGYRRVWHDRQFHKDSKIVATLKGRPMVLRPCPGEAHGPEAGGMIDNCMICAPMWGKIYVDSDGHCACGHVLDCASDERCRHCERRPSI